ncbi:hypothetical protein FRB99_001968, partial [Tulasnella sp. 403]
ADDGGNRWSKGWKSSYTNVATSNLKRFGFSAFKADLSRELSNPIPQLNDPEFIDTAVSVASDEPVYADFVTRICDVARASLSARLPTLVPSIVQKVEVALKREIRSRYHQAARAREAEETATVIAQLRNDIQATLTDDNSRPTLTIHSVKKEYYHSPIELDATVTSHIPPKERQYEIWPIAFHRRDRTRPSVSEGPAVRFAFPLEWKIRLCHTFDGDALRWLLVVDRPDGIAVWLFGEAGCDITSPTVFIPRSAVWNDFVVTFDGQSRRLAVIFVTPRNHMYQLFAVDDSLTNLRQLGNLVDITTLYPTAPPPNIHDVALFAGARETFLIDESGEAMTFSVDAGYVRSDRSTLRLALPQFTSPFSDGKSLLAVNPDGTRLAVIQRSSTGLSEGGSVDLPAGFQDAISFSTVSADGSTLLLAYSPTTHGLVCTRVDVDWGHPTYDLHQEIGSTPLPSTRSSAFEGSDEDRVSRPMVTPRAANYAAGALDHPRAGFPLLDKLADMWSTHPPTPAIDAHRRRDDIPSHSITLVSKSRGSATPTRYLQHLIHGAQKLSPRSVRPSFDGVTVQAKRFDDVRWTSPPVATRQAGQWLAEFLSSIPLQVATTLDNRFIPLSDGILDADLEQQLLDADVPDVMNNISLGWFEPIFRLYMSSMPVRVISSVDDDGERSARVLDHVVGSSFGGSGAVSHPGVWLAARPVDGTLVVALQVHGARSGAHATQEEMLLALFDTALSNLTLITDTSGPHGRGNPFLNLQAATDIMSPQANPGLFRGRLAIAVNAEAGEEDKAMSKVTSRLRGLISNEQEANFVTSLHDSQVTIVPWDSRRDQPPDGLAEHLFRQAATHRSAGDFSTMFKGLMAKLKLQDWAPIGDTIAQHRARTLLDHLPSALESGKVNGGTSDLRNLDDQKVVPLNDTGVTFYLGNSQPE